jgi:hypothetical protein
MTEHLAPFGSALSAARIPGLLESSWPVPTAGGTLITVLITWLVTLFLTRKRIAWRVCTDDEFKLDRGQAESAGERISLKIGVPPPAKGCLTCSGPPPPRSQGEPASSGSPTTGCRCGCPAPRRRPTDVDPRDEVTEPTVGVVTLNNLAIDKNSRFTLMAGYTSCPAGGSTTAAALCAQAGGRPDG